MFEVELLIASLPDLTKSSLADFFFQNPPGPGNGLVDRRSPPQYGFNVGRKKPTRFFAIRRLLQFGFARFADFTNFQRLLHSLHQVGSVTEPRERLELFKFFSSQGLPSGVKWEARQ